MLRQVGFMLWGETLSVKQIYSENLSLLDHLYQHFFKLIYRFNKEHKLKNSKFENMIALALYDVIKNVKICSNCQYC